MKVLVLSSGGIDSTTALGMAVNKYGKENVISLSHNLKHYFNMVYEFRRLEPPET